MKKIVYSLIILVIAGVLMRCVSGRDINGITSNQTNTPSAENLITLIDTATPIPGIEQTAAASESTPTLIQPTAAETHSSLPTFALTPLVTGPPTQAPTPTATPLPQFRRLTHGDCCTAHYWTSDTEIRFIDQNPETGETGIWAVDVGDENASPTFISKRVGIFSSDLRYFAYPDRTTGFAIIEDQETGESWSLNLNGSPVNFSPESDRILWIEVDNDLPFEARTPEFWVADVSGDNAKRITSLPRTSALAWSDRNTLLIAKLENRAADSQFAIREVTIAHLSLLDGSIYPLFRVERPREVSMNAAQTALVYFTALAENPENNGIWYADITKPHPIPHKLPILGSYKWRNDRTLIYIPFDSEAEHHFFHSYDVITGESRQLTDATQPVFTITNNDWTISPDGSKIVFLAVNGEELDGLWLIDLAP